MFSSNLRQFGIRHVLIGTVLVSIAMGLIATQWNVTVMLGIIILVGFSGGVCSYVMMFISDLIDERRIDERNRRSRFLNFVGLLIILLTALTVMLLSVVFLFLTLVWSLEKVP